MNVKKHLLVFKRTLKDIGFCCFFLNTRTAFRLTLNYLAKQKIWIVEEGYFFSLKNCDKLLDVEI